MRFDRLSSMVARPAFLPAFFSRRLFGPPPFGPRRRLARRLYGGPLRRRSDHPPAMTAAAGAALWRRRRGRTADTPQFDRGQTAA